MNIKKEFALLPLLAKYKKRLLLIYSKYFSKWKIKENKIQIFINTLTNVVVFFSEKKFMKILKQKYIVNNKKRKIKIKLNSIIFPLLKKVMLIKKVVLLRWYKKSQLLEAKIPYTILTQFLSKIYNKITINKSKKIKLFSHGIKNALCKLVIRKLLHNAKIKSLICVLFNVRHHMKLNIQAAFNIIGMFSHDQKYKPNHSSNKLGRLKSRKILNVVIKSFEYKKSMNRRENIQKLAYFTIIKIIWEKWIKQANAIKYRVSGRSQKRLNTKSLIKALIPIFKKRLLSHAEIFMKQMRRINTNKKIELFIDQELKEKNIFLINIQKLTGRLIKLLFESLKNKLLFIKQIKGIIIFKDFKKYNLIFQWFKWRIICKSNKNKSPLLNKIIRLFKSYCIDILIKANEVHEISFASSSPNTKILISKYVNKKIDNSFGLIKLFN